MATKNISDHPPKGTVTAPTDPGFKKQDIERKLKLYSVIDAMRQNKYPSNKQIDDNMRYALEHSPIKTEELSHEGQELVRDFQSIIETARQIVISKNQDELFQNFLWSANKTDNSKINPAKQVDGNLTKDQAKAEGNEAIKHLETLGKLIITNGEFRKVMKDLSLLARDVAADAAQKGANVARPGDEHLNQIDEPAPSHTWESEDKAMGPIHKAKDAAQKGKQAKDQVAEEAAITADNAERQERARQGLGQVVDEAQDPVSRDQRLQDTKENVKQRIPEERKQQLREQREKTKEYAQNKFPEERRDRFIYRLKKIVVECQEREEYNEAVRFFIHMAKTYKGRGQEHTNAVQGHAKDNVWGNPDFKAAFDNFRTLLERFANNNSMQRVFDSTDLIYTDVESDPELKAWFSKAGDYLERALLEPGWVMQEECNVQGRELRQSGKGFFSERYRPHREAWTHNVEEFFKAYADDPLNVQLGEDVKRFTKQLALDSEGKLAYKPHLWQDIRSVILPELLSQINYIPIPRIEYSDKTVDLVIENLNLDAPNILPNIIEADARNKFKLSPHKTISNHNNHEVTIDFKQIQCDLRDVSYYYKKKSGFPRMSDNGLLDVLIGGEGICGKIHLSSSAHKHRVFDVKDVKVTMHQAKVTLRDSAKHQMLYNIMGPLANTAIKAAVPKAIEQAIRNGLEELDRQLVDINEQLEEAGESEERTKGDVLKNLFSRKKAGAEEKSDKAKEVAEKRQSQFKMVFEEKDQMLSWQSKQSTVARQGNAQREIQEQSDEWRSPIFDATTRPVKMPV